MLSTELQDAVCKFQVCIQLHTFFYYSPSSRFHMSEPVQIEKFPQLRSALSWFSFYINKHYPSFFSSLEQGEKLLKNENDRVIASKSYLIPGYLSNTAKKSAKLLLSSSSNQIDDIIDYIGGYLGFIPDAELRDSIRKIAVNCGFWVYGNTILRFDK